MVDQLEVTNGTINHDPLDSPCLIILMEVRMSLVDSEAHLTSLPKATHMVRLQDMVAAMVTLLLGWERRQV